MALALTAVLALPALAGARDRRLSARPGPVVVPIFAGELAAPMTAYRAYVRRLIGTLQRQTALLVGEVGAGDVTGAESTWLAAHLTWLQIGQDDGAYGAFGQLGREVDGTAAGLELGVASPRFTGFHRVELDLWTRHDLARAAIDAARLHGLIVALGRRRLSQELPMSVGGLVSWTRRTSEILEDGQQNSLSGDDDYGSGSGLASLGADVAATREWLTLLAPLIDPRSPRLVGRARRQLVGLSTAIQATRPAGQWVAVASLPTAERERVNAATGAVLETLAPAAGLLKIVNDQS